MSNIDKLIEQRARIDARIQAAKARLDQNERKLDTRRKVLLGAYVLETMRRANMSPADLDLAGERFSAWLTRDTDRALFNLPPLSPVAGQSTEPATEPDQRTG